MQYRVAMQLAVLTSLLLCSLTSGCQTEEHFFDVTGELFVLSAADHYDEALHEAREWKADAYLSRTSAMVSSSVAGTRPTASLTYMFHSSSAPEPLYILDFRDGHWSAEKEENESGVAATPSAIERHDWSLDSVDAWSIALANGGEDFLLHYQDPMTSMSVTLDYWRTRAGQERLAWRVNLFIVHGPGLDILIDPHTGDIIEAEERSMSGTMVATTPTPPATPWAPLPVCTPATPEAGRVSGLPERIAFESSRDGIAHIFLMDPDGSNIEQVTDRPDADSGAAWSPDGQRIAFTRIVGLNIDIYVVDADGANLQRLTDHPGYDREPTWSPDGSHIAFNSDRDGNYNIYIMDADGSNLTPLTDHPLADDNPDWSPDGCRIAFVSDRDHSPEAHIYVVNVDGSNLTQLTDGSSLDYGPKWSPDGRKIAFWSSPLSGSEGGPDIYVMEQDGSNRVRLTTGPCQDTGLVSHPGLTRIASWSLASTGQQGGKDVPVMPLTSGPCYGAYPVWSPDGTQIVFAMGRDDPSGSDIFLMNADGSKVVQLTEEAGRNIPCSWRR